MLTKHNIRYVNENRTYIFSSDRVTFNGIQSRLLSLLEELHSRRFGREAHMFRENLGISVHQYILKKRLVLCRASILGAGISRKYTSSSDSGVIPASTVLLRRSTGCLPGR